MKFLTKSRFKMAVECPTKLFYTGKRNTFEDTSTDDAFLQGLAEGGYQVGELAKLMFPGGIEVTGQTNADQLAETRALLRHNNVTIFEGAIAYSNLFARMDIIHKNGNTIELIEVKSKSYNPSDGNFFIGRRGDIKNEILPYLLDIAFQRYVFGLAYPGLASGASSYLMLADKSAICTVDQLNQKFPITRRERRVTVSVIPGTSIDNIGVPLLRQIPVGNLVTDIIGGNLKAPGIDLPFAKAVDHFAAIYAADHFEAPVIGSQCAKCQFRLTKKKPDQGLRSGIFECWARHGVSAHEFTSGTVLDLWNFRKKGDLIGANCLRLADVTEEDIKPKAGGPGLSRSERQWMQVSGDLRGQDRFYLDRELIRAEIARWQYPLHFIDFETTRVAIPFTHGERPYGNVAFQFSHHIMYADGRVEHRSQFLNSTPGVNPNEEFIRSLMADLGGDDGTVFMWSKHENTVLKELLADLRSEPPNEFAAIEEFVLSLTTDKTSGHAGIRAMYDLCLLAERAFFHPMTKGSSSIKKVLPAVLQESEWLAERYGQPIYGRGLNIPSLNFAPSELMIWWSKAGGAVVNPYDKLPPVFPDIVTNDLKYELSNQGVDMDMEVAEGAGAMMAYGRLQFEKLSPVVRLHIEKALLRYCELDTLAMVMVVEAWREWSA
jgi:hypothetical protein